MIELKALTNVNIDKDYGTFWNVYRRRRRWFFYVLIGGLFVMVIMSLLLGGAFRGGLAFHILFMIWTSASAIAGLQFQLLPCPRCKHPFCCTWWRNDFCFARRCVHCGLPKWAKNDLPEDDL